MPQQKTRRERREMARNGRGRRDSLLSRMDRWTLTLAAIGAAALILRLIYLGQLAHTPMWSILFGDAEQYDAWGRRIAGGEWVGTQVFYQTPLYPYWLGTIYALAGHSVATVRVLQAVLGSLSCVLIGIAGRRFLSPTIGLLAAALLAVYPEAIFFDGLIQKSALDLFIMTALLATLGLFSHTRRRRYLWMAGACLGAFALNRENALVLLLVVPAWLFWRDRSVPRRQRLGWIGLVAAGFALMTLPVLVRNLAISGEWFISTSQFGANFYIGNHRGASGGYEPLQPGRGNAKFERADAVALAEQATGRQLSPGEVSRYWFRRAVADIQQDPVAWVRLFGRKLLLVVNASEIVDTESMREYAMYCSVLGILRWFTFGILIALALAGAIVWPERSADIKLLYSLAVALFLAVAAFYVFSRYRYPVVPVLALFGAAAVDSARRRVGPARRWIAASGAGVALAVVAYLPLVPAGPQTHFNVALQLKRLGRPAEAVPWMERAVAMRPDEIETRLALGLLRLDAGDINGARTDLTEVIKVLPKSPEAHAGLARALGLQGSREAALAEWKAATESPGAQSSAFVSYGLALWNAGRRDEATAQYRQAIQVQPDDPVAYNNLALALHQAGHNEEAIAAYEKALSLKPDYPEAHGNLAILLGDRGELDAAIQHATAAVRGKSDSHGLHANLGDLLLRAGKPDAAAAEYREAISRSPDDVPVVLALMERLINAYARAGRADLAREELTQAIALAEAAKLPADAARLKQLLASLQGK